MNKKLWLLVAAATGMSLSAASFNASAQSSGGYWTEPAGNNMAWKNGSGQCWRASYWSPAMATIECDPD
ncbi:MAG: OmpA family protein, partial [Burkholderiales bacterium]